MSHQESAISVVKYFLNVAEKKLPVKRSDIMTAIKDSGMTPKNYPDILLMAERHLSQTFGYRIQDVTVKNSKVYIVVPKNITSHMVVPPGKQPEITLLYLTLTYIFMKGDRVAEKSLWRFLNSLQITEQSDSHPYFGNVKKLITETFVKQLYLIREKVDEEGGTEFVFYYSWGPRSGYELSKKAVLEYVAKLLKRPTKCFVQQYREIGAEGESSQTTQSQPNSSQAPQASSTSQTQRQTRSRRSQPSQR